ncbi:hypothetical protein HDV00_002408 [Rhizophlyctis rosea]|nr:hypothetical protein HDV00_002408 [Rhizophlyctis rosea]
MSYRLISSYSEARPAEYDHSKDKQKWILREHGLKLTPRQNVTMPVPPSFKLELRIDKTNRLVWGPKTLSVDAHYDVEGGRDIVIHSDVSIDIPSVRLTSGDGGEGQNNINRGKQYLFKVTFENGVEVHSRRFELRAYHSGRRQKPTKKRARADSPLPDHSADDARRHSSSTGSSTSDTQRCGPIQPVGTAGSGPYTPKRMRMQDNVRPFSEGSQSYFSAPASTSSAFESSASLGDEWLTLDNESTGTVAQLQADESGDVAPSSSAFHEVEGIESVLRLPQLHASPFAAIVAPGSSNLFEGLDDLEFRAEFESLEDTSRHTHTEAGSALELTSSMSMPTSLASAAPTTLLSTYPPLPIGSLTCASQQSGPFDTHTAVQTTPGTDPPSIIQSREIMTQPTFKWSQAQTSEELHSTLRDLIDEANSTRSLTSVIHYLQLHMRQAIFQRKSPAGDHVIHTVVKRIVNAEEYHMDGDLDMIMDVVIRSDVPVLTTPRESKYNVLHLLCDQKLQAHERVAAEGKKLRFCERVVACGRGDDLLKALGMRVGQFGVTPIHNCVYHRVNRVSLFLLGQARNDEEYKKFMTTVTYPRRSNLVHLATISSNLEFIIYLHTSIPKYPWIRDLFFQRNERARDSTGDAIEGSLALDIAVRVEKEAKTVTEVQEARAVRTYLEKHKLG